MALGDRHRVFASALRSSTESRCSPSTLGDRRTRVLYTRWSVRRLSGVRRPCSFARGCCCHSERAVVSHLYQHVSSSNTTPPRLPGPQAKESTSTKSPEPQIKSLRARCSCGRLDQLFNQLFFGATLPIREVSRVPGRGRVQWRSQLRNPKFPPATPAGPVAASSWLAPWRLQL